jgi:hypothetical protein
MKRLHNLSYSLFLISYSLFVFTSCSVSKEISKKANSILLKDSAISKGHIGISIYEPLLGNIGTTTMLKNILYRQ